MNDIMICPICEERCKSDECDHKMAGHIFSAFVCKRVNRLFYVDHQILRMENLEIGQFYYTLIIDDLINRGYMGKEHPHYCLGSASQTNDSDVYIDVTKVSWYRGHFERVDRSLLNIYRIYGENTFGLRNIIGMRCLLCTNDKEALARENSLLNFGYIARTDSRNDSEKYIISKEGWRRLDEIRRKDSDRTGFVAMAFREETNEIRDVLKESITKCGFKPIVIDEVEHNNQIVPEIERNIQRCRFLVMDCSVPNMGAYFEAGMAAGFGKEVIICCNEESFQDENSRPHFDVRQKSMIIWKNLDDLKNRLVKRILCTVEGAQIKEETDLNDMDSNNR